MSPILQRGEPRSHTVAAVLWLLVAVAGLYGAPFPSSQPTPQGASTAKDYALIYGTVWGPDNQPVAGVPITIRRSIDKKPKWQLVSDRRGEFAQRVPPGNDEYIVQADIKVPKGEPKPEIKVHIDNNERQDVGIHLKSLGTGKK